MKHIIPPPVPYLHLLERVSVETREWPDAAVVVKPIWKGVDRPDGTGIAFRPIDDTLARRLEAVILRGDAYSE